MDIKTQIENACFEAATLDGTAIVSGGGAGAVYLGISVACTKWLAKADWSNKFQVFEFGVTPEEALDNLIKRLKEMKG